MSLIEYQFDRKIDKVKQAIDRVRLAALSPEPLYVCYSGGKDSRVLRRIMEMSGVKHELHYSLTTVDIPEIVQEIIRDKAIIVDKSRYPDSRQKTMWNLIASRKIPPTRLIRYCCSELKEVGGMGRICVTGVRKAESVSRKQSQGEVTVFSAKSKLIADDYGAEYIQTPRGGLVMNLDNDANRRVVEQCYRTNKTLINPLIDWTDADIWEFSRAENIRQSDYYKVFKRIGCIGCPMASKRERQLEFELFPTYKAAYIHAFDRMLKNLDRATWHSGEEVFDWWLNGKRAKPLEGQFSMFEDII